MKSSSSLPYYESWPKIQSAIKTDPYVESEINRILNLMTLEEKVGQMIQPEIREVTPEEIKEFKIGSILNGGGAWPNNNKYADPKEWAEKSDEFWYATEEMFADRPFRIPFFWATDAVHGHNNVYGATVFPHNIGLGCARDPKLIKEIGRVTAKEIAATGLDWTFAPTVATPRDLRWGRVYEGYSEDPELTFQYAKEMVEGLQGSAEDLKGEEHVISNVKHWVGDGGTLAGQDRGANHYSETLLRNIHAMGYFSGLEAGAQVVMSSFNSWVNEVNYDQEANAIDKYNKKVHGSKYLITDVLKNTIGFDGLVVTDWHGHAEVNKCTDGNANYAVNAGNDILMVPTRENWQAVYRSIIEGVKSGEVSIERVDDAVTRILRVKMRANLWQKPAPSKRKLAGDNTLLGCASHRAVAREAVSKSLVLLKNKNETLPLKKGSRVYLTGSAANDIQKQAGGWNLTWQGNENTLADFPSATTLKMALEEELGSESVLFDPNFTGHYKKGDVAIVAFGEDPYAEMMGDIKSWQNLQFSSLKKSYKKDCEIIEKLHSAGVKVISIFFSGRPLYVNELINCSEAFIAAFLPGSECKGITDVIIGDEQGKPRKNFVGKLSFSWPNKKESYTVNKCPDHIPNYILPTFEQDPKGQHQPLFEYGYGLNYTDRLQSQNLDNLALDLDDDLQGTTTVFDEHLFGIDATVGDYSLKLADAKHWMGVDVSRNNTIKLHNVISTPYNYQQQQDALLIEMWGENACIYIQTDTGLAQDFSGYYDSGKVSFDLKVIEPITGSVNVGTKKEFSPELQGCVEGVDLTSMFSVVSDKFIKVEFPCEQLAADKKNLLHVDTPFVMNLSGKCKFAIANICWKA